MDVLEVSAEDTAVVADVVELANAVAGHDAPWEHPATVRSLAGMLRHGWDGDPPRAFVAREGSTVVGTCELWVGRWDNPQLAWLGLSIHPEHRGRGLGSDLLSVTLDRVRGLGRTSVGMDAWDSAGARTFAARHGFALKSQAINRRQYVGEVDRGLVDELYAEARTAAGAYELVRIDGRTPDAMLATVVAMTAAINDAPLDDLQMDDEVFTPERVRAYEDATLGRGQRLHRLVARHRETGELAGHTVVAVEEERPALGHQHDTSVLRPHRGHRLGLLLKAGMLRWLADAEPQLGSVDTWNAESNDHMIAVNEALGYRVMGRALQFQRTL